MLCGDRVADGGATGTEIQIAVDQQSVCIKALIVALIRGQSNNICRLIYISTAAIYFW